MPTATYTDLAEARGAIAVTPMGRGPDGWYLREAEVDVFDVWRDVASVYELDPDRVDANGYSMGGYGTFRLAARYPDLFNTGFAVVGPPAEGIVLTGDRDDTVDRETNTFHILDNLRHIPLLLWNGTADELVPITGTLTHAQRLDDLGYRYYQDVFVADHFALSLADDWTRASSHLSTAPIDRHPARVTYRVMPAADEPALGLVADKAYWLWDVRMREDAGDPATGLVDVRSLAFGVGEPETEPVAGGGPDPLPYVRRGQEWAPTPEQEASNALEVAVTNVAAVTIGLERARITTDEDTTVVVTTDGPAALQLAGAFTDDVSVRDVDAGAAVPFAHTRAGLTVSVEAGTHTLLIAAGAVGDDPDRVAGPAPSGSLPATGGGAAGTTSLSTRSPT